MVRTPALCQRSVRAEMTESKENNCKIYNLFFILTMTSYIIIQLCSMKQGE